MLFLGLSKDYKWFNLFSFYSTNCNQEKNSKLHHTDELKMIIRSSPCVAALLLWLICYHSIFAVAASENSVYAAGDLVRANPIESSVIFLCVVVASAFLEFALDRASNIKAKYFQVMFSTVNQEVMIVGVLVLVLMFAENLYDWPNRWVLIFKWSMMCLFFMVISFILLILLILFVVQRSDSSWSTFETERMDAESEKFSDREMKYKASFFRFLGALKVYGYNANMGIRYSTYLSKLMRKNVVALTDLTWVSWVCLATVVVLNALRTEAFRRLSEHNDENLDDDHTTNQRLLLYLSFVGIVGYGILALFIIMYKMLSYRLTQFLAMTESSTGASSLQQRLLDNGSSSARATNAVDNLDDSRAFLFRRSLEVTLEMLQILLLALLWYISTFVLSFSYPIVNSLRDYAAPIIIAAVMPIVIVMFLMPWTLMLITILGSLGNNLDENTIQTQIRKAEVPIEELPEKMREALRANAQRKLAKQVRKGLQTRQGNIRSAPTLGPKVGLPRSLQKLQEQAAAPIGV